MDIANDVLNAIFIDLTCLSQYELCMGIELFMVRLIHEHTWPNKWVEAQAYHRPRDYWAELGLVRSGPQVHPTIYSIKNFNRLH